MHSEINKIPNQLQILSTWHHTKATRFTTVRRKLRLGETEGRNQTVSMTTKKLPLPLIQINAGWDIKGRNGWQCTYVSMVTPVSFTLKEVMMVTMHRYHVCSMVLDSHPTRGGWVWDSAQTMRPQRTWYFSLAIWLVGWLVAIWSFQRQKSCRIIVSIRVL